jgi:hypothetical protein
MRFAGVVNTIKKRMQESTSEVTRQWYGKYFREQLCRACNGARLRPESRAVLLAGQDHGRGHLDDRGGAKRTLPEPGPDRRARADRRRDPEGGERAPGLPAGRGPRVPDARPGGGHAVGRRGAADPPGVAARLRAVGRDVRARRAVDRPAPARQPAPDRDAAPAARSRQQRDRRRARRRDHRGGRSRRRLRSRRRAPGRARGGRGHARRHQGQPRLADRQVPGGRRAHRDPRERRKPKGFSRSRARASTTCATSTSTFRSACWWR